MLTDAAVRKAQRLEAEKRGAEAGQKKRAERTGAVPLVERAQEIREALNTRTWQRRSDALAAIGLQLEPVLAGTQAKRLRGLTIADITDPGNKLKASALDIGGQKFGLGSRDKWILKRSPNFETWLLERKISPSCEPNQTPDVRSELKEDYDLEVTQHKLDQKQRKAEASLLKPSERREFYSQFSKGVRKRELADLDARHTAERLPLRLRRMPTWQQFITARAEAGCHKAGAVLETMRPIQTVKRSVSAVAPKQQLSVSKKQPSKDQQPASQRAALTPRSQQPFLPRRNQAETEIPEHLAAYWQRQKGDKGRS